MSVLLFLALPLCAWILARRAYRRDPRGHRGAVPVAVYLWAYGYALAPLVLALTVMVCIVAIALFAEPPGPPHHPF